MKRILVTGAAGFIGQNLCTALGRASDVKVTATDVDTPASALEDALATSDIVYHLAGVNRPETEDEFRIGNVGSTEHLARVLTATKKAPLMVLASSIQAELANPYGQSKRAAEQVLLAHHERTGCPVAIYRLPNVFGKWSRPNYNTVVATFCHNIARGEPIQVNDRNRELELVYVDDVVQAFLQHLAAPPDPSRQRYTVSRTFRVTLGELAERIRVLHAMRENLVVPDLADELNRCLHATYLSFLPASDLGRPVTLRTDQRGWLFELIKSPHLGQIFVSRSAPGVTRGNHYHDTKIERFCVIQGEATIRLRHLVSGERISLAVSDRDIRIVDIPPGYTHSIENTGSAEMVALFWANAIFDPAAPDTYALEVLP